MGVKERRDPKSLNFTLDRVLPISLIKQKENISKVKFLFFKIFYNFFLDFFFVFLGIFSDKRGRYFFKYCF